MTTRHDPDLTIAAWLDDGPTRLPESTGRAIAVSIRTSRQTLRPMWAPWRNPPMSSPARLLAAALVAIVAIGGVVYAVTPRGSGVGPPIAAASPSPTPSASASAPRSPTPAPSPSPISTADWLPFTSAWYGFGAAYPPGYAPKRATLHWNLVRDQTVFHDSIDSFTAPTGSPKLEGYGTRLPAGTTSDAFLAQYIAPNLTSNCYEQPEQWEPVTVDGHPARIARSGCSAAFHAAEAIVVVGDRIWWFGTEGTDEALLRAYLTTIRLHPETAIDETVKGSAKP
jgi:hypothetical protein